MFSVGLSCRLGQYTLNLVGYILIKTKQTIIYFFVISALVILDVYDFVIIVLIVRWKEWNAPDLEHLNVMVERKRLLF